MNTKEIFISPQKKSGKDIPEFRPSDTLRVAVRIIEADAERQQHFEGTVIGRHGSELDETFTVRKISFGIGIERTFHLHSPNIMKLEVTKRGDVRRAKLYYLRKLIGKKSIVKEQVQEKEAAAPKPQ